MGRTALVLMLTLHLLQRLAPPALARVSETLGFRASHEQTLLAVVALAALVLIAGLLTATVSRRPAHISAAAARSDP